MWPVLPKRYTRNVDKEKQVTRVSDVSLAYERIETMLTEHLDTSELRVFPCRLYACNVYANRATLFSATGLDHGRGAI